MRKIYKIISILMSIIFFMSVLPQVDLLDVLADTTKTTYRISTVEDLYKIREDLNGIYILNNDIDLTKATQKGGICDYDGTGWNPIGALESGDYNAFKGTLDGRGHKITGMRIYNSKSSNVGLFAGIDGATIKDLTVSGTINSAKKATIGSFVGTDTSGTVSDCHSEVDMHLKSSGTVGGIVGMTKGKASIKNCSNKGDIEIIVTNGVGLMIGGICGSAYSTESNIEKCYNAGDIYESGTLNNGDMEVHGSGILGAVNTNATATATISNCYNSGNIQGMLIFSGTIFDSMSAYAICPVYNGDYGYIKRVPVSVKNCYNIGKIIKVNTYKHPTTGSWVTNRLKGSFGGKTSTSQDNYYLEGTCETEDFARPLTQAQMTTKNMMFYEGWSKDEWIVDDNTPYKYPQLKNNRYTTNLEITKIEVAEQKNPLRYYIGTEKIKNLEDLIIKIYYADGTSKMTYCKNFDYEFQSKVSDPRDYEVKIYPDKEYNPNKYIVATVIVTNVPKAVAINLVSLPNNTEFYEGKSFNFTGCNVEVAYDNGELITKSIDFNSTTGGDINVPGKQTITYTEDGVSVSFEINVIPKKIVGISVTTKPNKTEYYQDDKIVLTGMVAKAIYNSGVQTVISNNDLNVSYDFSKAGTQKVIVNYEDFTDSFDVNVIAKVAKSIEIVNGPTKKIYIQGQKVETEGMIVKATFNNGEVKEVTDYTVDMPTMKTGLQTVAVRCGDAVAYIAITVIAREPEQLEIVTEPNKTTYVEGDELDTTGLKVVARFNDGTVEEINDFQILNVDMESIGTKSVKITYGNLFVTFDIKIIEKVVEKITVEGKNSYIKGEDFDPNSLIVKAVYNNGKSEEIKDFQATGFTGNVGKNIIKVEYKGKEETFVVIVHESDEQWTIVKKATCSSEGEKVKYCKDCGEIVYKEKINKLPHTIVIDRGVEATCTSTGITEGKHCSVCDEVIEKQEVIPMLEHTEDEKWTTIKKPTCTNEGTQVKKCTVCGKVMKTKSIEAKGHNIVIDEAVEATCTKSGLTEGSHCIVCDEIIVAQKTVAALGHKYANFVHKSATCTEPEVAVGKCERCDSTKTAKISEALGHYYVTDKKVEPTCTKSGLTEGSHCSRCGLVKIKQEEIPATGHSVEKDWELEKKASCVQKGLKVKKCEKCDEVLESEEIEALGHDIVKDEAVEPTCSKDGLTEGEHCSRCGEILIQQKRIDALGHNIVKDEGTESTCDRKGITDGSHCDRCGEIIVRQIVIPTKTHTIIEVDSTPATYFENGYTGNIVCKVCGEQIRCGNIILKLKLNKPTLKVKALKNKAVIKIGKIKGITKYEIRYKQGKKWIKKYTKKTTYTLKKLHSKKKVTIRVRAVVQDKSKVLYSKYCSKKVRVR